MPDVLSFFLPHFSDAVTADNQEEVYKAFAALCRQSPPSRRIYSIDYRHDGSEWTATVGQQLKGVKITTTRSRGQKIERRLPVYDSATVLAIFPGDPYFVVTNCRFTEGVRSYWENPFMAGRPTSVTYFATTE